MEIAIELEDCNSKKYEVKVFYDSVVYVKELEDHLPGLYYLVSCKNYFKEENT